MSFKELIVSETKTLRFLHEAIHHAVPFRDRSPSADEAWRLACSDFHYHTSLLDPYFARVWNEPELEDQETIEFVITFLELDPRFFRSGYLKEVMLKKIGRAELSRHQVSRLRAVLLDAVLQRGGREFRRYCRLAARIGDDNLRAELDALLANDNEVASRARMMRNYVENS